MQFLVTLHHFLDQFFFYLSDWECFTNYPNTFSNSSWFFRLGRWRWNIHSSPRRIIIHSCCCSSCCCCCSGCSCCGGGGGSRCWCSTALRWRWEGKLFWWSSTSVATLLNKSSVNSILTSIFKNQEKCCFRSEVSWRRWIFLMFREKYFYLDNLLVRMFYDWLEYYNLTCLHISSSFSSVGKCLMMVVFDKNNERVQSWKVVIT